MCVFLVVGVSINDNILGLTCYDNSKVKKCIDPQRRVKGRSEGFCGGSD